ncbi:hypothetical protein FOL47_001134 [Perkinsus chesapeaki]|uniref:Uncharacterized protein n=1 Tax=Perkinsus chesapeaki TaxID=330153 RepID=A0A7J6KTN4_PERCH|nr:hypothetical protein FOL47_001134 [Perkinsus chesapeaki]
MASEFSLCLRYFMATYHATGSTDEADKSNDLRDSRIDPEGATNVLAFCRTLSTIKIAFPRFVDISNVLVFTDASVSAGHNTILCPTTVADSDKFYHKLVGKGRLWSTRTSQARWSIPKKELVSFFDGPSLATSLVTIYSEFAAETPIKCISLYCDSEAFVYRLRRASKGDFRENLSILQKKTLKKGLLNLDFIANTLQVSVTTYHIEGEFNPADAGSRPKIDGELPTLLEDSLIHSGHNLILYHLCPVTGLLLYSGVIDSNGNTPSRPVLPRGPGCDEVLSLLHDKLGHDSTPKLRSLYNEALSRRVA